MACYLSSLSHLLSIDVKKNEVENKRLAKGKKTVDLNSVK